MAKVWNAVNGFLTLLFSDNKPWFLNENYYFIARTHCHRLSETCSKDRTECQTIFNHLTRDTKGVGWDKKSLNYVQSFQQRGRFKIETVRCSVTRSTNLVSQWSALQCFPQLCGAGECLVLSVACRPAVTFLTAHHLTAIAAVTVCAAVSSLYSSTAADIMSLA